MPIDFTFNLIHAKSIFFTSMTQKSNSQNCSDRGYPIEPASNAVICPVWAFNIAFANYHIIKKISLKEQRTHHRAPLLSITMQSLLPSLSDTIIIKHNTKNCQEFIPYSLIKSILTSYI